MGLDDRDHVFVIGGTRCGKVTAQLLLARIARERGHKVVEILAEGTRTSLDPVLPGPDTPTCDHPATWSIEEVPRETEPDACRMVETSNGPVRVHGAGEPSPEAVAAIDLIVSIVQSRMAVDDQEPSSGEDTEP